MPMVIYVVLLFLEQQIGAVGGRCSSAEDATKRKFLQFKIPVNFSKNPNLNLPAGNLEKHD